MRIEELSTQAEHVGDETPASHLLFRAPDLMTQVKALFSRCESAALSIAPLTFDAVLDEALVARARQAPLNE